MTQSGNYTHTLTDIVQDCVLYIKTNVTNFRTKLIQLRQRIQEAYYSKQFQTFLYVMEEKDLNWKFWKQFVFVDALAYVGLFLAIRSGNWKLRVASIKLMASIFSAFDHQTYRRVIAQHLADIKSMPDNIISTFRKGTFAVSLNGRPWPSVALDEAHEMKINKECKTSIVCPSRDYLNRVAGYIPYRAKCILRDVFPDSQIVKRYSSARTKTLQISTCSYFLRNLAV